jgi:hypothetical protein
VSSTNAYAAKRALISRLKELVAEGPLSGVQVLYAKRGSLTNRCVYGGGVTFNQPEDEEVVDGRSRAVKETATIGIHIRVARSPTAVDGIEQADIDCEEISDLIAEEFAANPRLAGGHSASRIDSGQGDYSPDDASDISILSLRISVESWVTTERQQP